MNILQRTMETLMKCLETSNMLLNTYSGEEVSPAKKEVIIRCIKNNADAVILGIDTAAQWDKIEHHEIHISGSPDMDDETRQALVKMIGLAYNMDEKVKPDKAKKLSMAVGWLKQYEDIYGFNLQVRQALILLNNGRTDKDDAAGN